MTIKPHQQQHILLFYIIITVRSMKVLIGNTYLLSPAHTYLDIFKSVGYLNPIPNRDT